MNFSKITNDVHRAFKRSAQSVCLIGPLVKTAGGYTCHVAIDCEDEPGRVLSFYSAGARVNAVMLHRQVNHDCSRRWKTTREFLNGIDFAEAVHARWPNARTKNIRAAWRETLKECA